MMKVPRRVEAAQASKLVHVGGFGVSSAVPWGGVVEQVLSYVDQKRAPKGDDLHVTANVLIVRMHGLHRMVLCNLCR